MAKKKVKFVTDFSFYEQLWYYYSSNRGKIRSRYNDLTRKFLSYNDKNDNPDAFLRKPQFEALEMYVFIKEFMDNAHMFEMFDDWRNRRNNFSDASYYTIHKRGQGQLIDMGDEQNEFVFNQMKQLKEDYPNYIYALAMGLGKTVLMGTCIFYEFLLSNKYPKDKRFCHNALVFAPDKTVLDSLREIMTFDKTKVVPPEYAHILDNNIRFHFLEQTGTSLHTIDGSKFNIVISNNQKIIVKHKHTKNTPTEELFSSLLGGLYDNEELNTDEDVIDNQRFQRLCRLPQLGVYVDEAHHLFGSKLEKELRDNNEAKTTLRFTINRLHERAHIVACYNFTGTPYVDNQVLPEVVYGYGLSESIRNGYLKDAAPKGYSNVKDEEFLRSAVSDFWKNYGGKTYEGLVPKLAIFAAGIDEAVNVVRPAVERILTELGVPLSTILVNTGDEKITKDSDIQDFRNLDVVGTNGSKKQFIILVQKGREGWNCRSLLGIALFRSPKSTVFVLQATMRCLRQLTTDQLTARVYLSQENLEILESELKKNFNMDIADLTNKKLSESKPYNVRVNPPPRIIKMKKIWHEYSLHEKEYKSPIDFHLADLDLSKYERTVTEIESLRYDTNEKKKNIDESSIDMRYSAFSLTGEIARYLNISCLLVSKMLNECVDGIDTIIELVSKYNRLLYDIIIPGMFHTLYEVTSTKRDEDIDVVLLRDPTDKGFYSIKGKDGLVVTMNDTQFNAKEVAKSFHADTYCFDSKPEKECFSQYIHNDKVKEVYFTGMFTANQGDLSIQYYDPDSQRIRHYYPDFIAKMEDGSYRLIEVKGDNKIDDVVVQAKKAAAEELATASTMEYVMYPGSVFSRWNVLDPQYDEGREQYQLFLT